MRAVECVPLNCVGCGSVMMLKPYMIRYFSYCSKNCKSGPPAFMRKVVKSDSCWIFTGEIDVYGYGVFHGYRDGVACRTKAHRWSYMHHKGPIAKGLQVLHSCDNPPCVNPDHLSTGTDLQNHIDCTSKGRQARGESSGRTSITESGVVELRRMYAGGVFLKDIAARFDITIASARFVALGITWKHIPGICEPRRPIKRKGYIGSIQ